MTNGNPRIRVAVLGGGCGAMAAAFELTSTPELRQRYEVTVYQQGWRLGGKGASGRNASAGQRIEEHGLHAFLGFYDNAFRLMRDCYGEWKREPGNPFQCWDDAVKPQRLITLQDQLDASGTRWSTWNIDMPPLPGTPGTNVGPSLVSYLERLLAWLVGLAEQTATHAPQTVADSVTGFLASALQFARTLDPDPTRHSAEDHAAMLAHIASARASLIRLAETADPVDDWLRRIALLLDLGFAVAKGLIEDVLPPWKGGFDALNAEELRAWLARHGASAASTWSAPVRALYDLGFAFVRGDSSSERNAQIAAGVGLKIMLLIGFGYKDAPLWKLQAGMGDVIFAPLYQVLAEQRGVKFEFFHRVQNLALSPDQKLVASIELSRQVDLAVPSYAPLEPVQGLPCWPNEPFWAQIKDGDALRRAGVDLESAWCLRETGRRTLRLGVDYDLVVLGISVGALPYLTRELAAASDAWRNMLEQTATVQTQAMQLWLTPTLPQLGWTAGTTIMTAYAEPLDSWGEMSHLIPRESWPPTHQPQSIEYFCGTLEDARVIPPFTDPTFPAVEKQRVFDNGRRWLETRIGHLWPEATQPTDPAALDWNKLVDLSDGTGVARYAAQYVRANIDPTERYVLSVPDSIRFRLPAGGSGFDNLYLAGDWVLSSLNGGCAEAAFETGIRAARAISGVAFRVFRDGEARDQ